MRTQSECEAELAELERMRTKFPESKPWTDPLVQMLLWVHD
jgi:hypothetical protein